MQRSARFIGPALRTGLSALLLAAAGCTGAHEGSATGSADPPTADQVPVADLRADFDALYAGLRDAHFDLYARRDRDAYEARYRAMRAGFDHPLTPLQARIAFQRFVAYGNVAHARIDPPLAEWERFRTGGGKAFPLFVRVQGGQAWIIDGTRGLDAVEPGDRLLSVDGVPALAWLERLRVHLSADNDYMAWAQLERQLPLLAWLEFGERPMFQIEVAKPDDRRISLALPARARGEPVTTHTAGVPARFELDANTREARMLADCIAYLRPGPFYDNRPQATHPWDPTDFRGFLDAAFADMLARGATRLLIDLRDNPGGDNSFSDPMIAWFADRPFRFSNAFEIRVSDATIHSNRKLPLLSEFALKPGRITLCRITQGEGKLRLMLAGGEMIKAPLAFSGTAGTAKLDIDADSYRQRLLDAGMEHHTSLVYGEHRPLLRKVARLLNLEVIELT